MDWDLWGPSYVQDAPESSYLVQPRWQCDFYFGCGLDVMEEDALNEKSCVQVLRVLIAKADTEIEELEKDLVILRSELAWAESREWSEICSTSLREKINCLDISIQSLKNENEHDIYVHLPMNRKPAERIHEIIKVLLGRHCLEKDEQAGSFTIENSSTDTTNQGSGCSTENKKVSNFCLKIVKEEVQHGSTGAPDIVILESSLKPKANRGEVDEKVEPPSTVVEDLSLDAREHSTNKCDEKLSHSYTKDDSAPRDECKILISSLKSGGKRRNYQKVIKKQPTNIIVKNSSSDVARCEVGLYRKKKSHVSISRSDVFVQTDSASADAKPTISNYPLKTVQGKIVKRSKLAASNKVNSVKSSFMPDKKSMTVQEADISNYKRSAINSLPNLQDQTGKDTTKPQAEEEGTSDADKIQPAKTPANDQDSILCLSPKLSKPKMNRKVQSNQLSIQEAGLSPSGSGFRSSSPLEIKRRPKFGISKDNANLKQSLDAKILKSLVLQNNREGDELSLTPELNGNSVLLPDKRKMSLKLRIPMEIEDPSTHHKLLKLNADITGGAGKEDLFIINSCCIGDSHELPCPTLRLHSLERMKLVDLRAIAKKHNMRKYHKLKKEALVQAIADQQC